MMICPDCGEKLFFRELSSSGDGLMFCPKCNWIEDPTKTGDKYRGIYKMQVNIKKVKKYAQLPQKMHETDAGFDLAANNVVEKENNIISYGTGLAFEIPKGYVGLIFPRSSIGKTCLHLCNGVAVIDSGYRGEVKAEFRIDHNSNLRRYKVGERICQIVILPYPEIYFNETKTLLKSDRGEAGFGSTGLI